jgi:branched-subunit amino acid aminotransferase/4-amino-4-deoxychorismate lyase
MPGYQFREEALMPSDLEAADGVFITSSTRDALAVHAISSLRVQNEANHVVEAVNRALNRCREDYVASHHQPALVENSHVTAL